MFKKIIFIFSFLTSLNLLAQEQNLKEFKIRSRTYNPDFLKVGDNLDDSYRYQVFTIVPIYYHGVVVFEISAIYKHRLQRIIEKARVNKKFLERFSGKNYGKDTYIHENIGLLFIESSPQEDFFNIKTVHLYKKAEQEIQKRKRIRIEETQEILKNYEPCSCSSSHHY